MSKKFVVSAPGKIILHGEHSVVYNKPAIAGPIGLRTYFEFEESSESFITFDFKRLDLILKMKFETANLFLSSLELLPPTEFLQKLRISKDFILKLVEVPRILSEKEEMAISATLFIFHRILLSEKIIKIPGCFTVKIDSDIAIGAGIGSSASFGVSLAGGFFIYSQIINENIENFDNFCFNDEILEKISQWAFDSEVLMHEKPSGIDNTICTYGQLVKFNRGEKPQTIKTQGSPIDILLVDTGVSRSTSNVVGKVANFRNRHLSLANSIFDSMGFLVDDVVKILEFESVSDDAKFQELSELISVNNNLLRAIGVSHPRLETVFNIAESFNFHAKLTGAGAGGCAFVILPSNYKNSENYEKMCEELKANKFQILPTVIATGSGVELKVEKN